jgi:hypothetical protein
MGERKGCGKGSVDGVGAVDVLMMMMLWNGNERRLRRCCEEFNERWRRWC